MNNLSAEQQAHQNDEIDLFQLFSNIWKERIIIGIITSLFTIMGIITAFTTQPVYKASVYLQSPNSTSLQTLQSLSLLNDLTGNILLTDFIKKLESTDFKAEYLKNTNADLANTTPQDSEILAKQIKIFSESFKISEQSANEKPALFPYKAEFSAPSAERANIELDRFISHAKAALIKDYTERHKIEVKNDIARSEQLITLLEAKIKNERQDEITRLKEVHTLELRTLQDQLQARKAAYKVALADRIHALEEALSIASSLKLAEPSSMIDLGKQKRTQVQVDIQGKNEPLYLRGTRLITAELEQLKSRQPDYFPDNKVRELEVNISLMEHNRKIDSLSTRNSDHPFSQDIQELKAHLMTVRNEKFPDSLNITFSTSKAYTNNSPVKPRINLIIALSFIMGGMVGIIIALIRRAISNRKHHTH